MGVTFGAGDCGADHPESCVADFGYVFGGNRRPETRPSRARFELGGGIEERVVAADAAVDALVVQVPTFSRKGDFGVGIAGNVEDTGRKLLAPLAFGLDDLRDAGLFQALA